VVPARSSRHRLSLPAAILAAVRQKLHSSRLSRFPGPALSFATVEELRRALLAFREAYNTTWLIERHGFRPPVALREEQLSPAALAA
jgi:hypothetical protein